MTDFKDGIVTGESGEDESRDFSRATFDLLVPDVGVGARHCRVEHDSHERAVSLFVGQLCVAAEGILQGECHSVIVDMVRRGQRGTTLQIALGKEDERWSCLWQR